MHMLWVLTHIMQNVPGMALSVLHLCVMYFLPINSFSIQESASLIITVAMRETLQHLGFFGFFVCVCMKGTIFRLRTTLKCLPHCADIINFTKLPVASLPRNFLLNHFITILCGLQYYLRSLGTGLSQAIPHSQKSSVVKDSGLHIQWMFIGWMNELGIF